MCVCMSVCVCILCRIHFDVIFSFMFKKSISCQAMKIFNEIESILVNCGNTLGFS